MRRTHIGTTILGVLVAVASIGAIGCGPGTIAGTQVEATEDNLAVYDVVQRYRRAIEERDLDALAALVSRDYFENAGTTDTEEDDYGYDKLRQEVMPVLRSNIKQVRLDVRVLDIEVHGNRAFAKIEYFARFLYSEGGRDGWTSWNDFDRLELVREPDGWKIVSGL